MTKKQNAREQAYEALLAIEKDGRQSHLVIREKWNEAALQKEAAENAAREKAFFLRLVQGVLEYRLQLEYVIGLYSRTPVKKMKPQIRVILQTGVYQILYMYQFLY